MKYSIKYSVYLDEKLKAKNLSFKDAIRVATDLSKDIGWVNSSKRVQIVEQEEK